MAFPQPDADKYAIDGYKFFRLNTLLASPGDMYESAQSAHALAIGPDSDIASVVVNYFDQLQPGNINELLVTQNRSYVGLVNANNLSQYTPSNRPAKILIWPNDLWNPQYFPFFTGSERDDGSTQILEVPRLDIIEYFQPQGSLVPKRNDKEWFYQTVTTPTLASAKAYVTIPYYGRRYAKILFQAEAAAFMDIDIYGVDLQQQAQVDAGLGTVSVGNVGIGTSLTGTGTSKYHNLHEFQFIINDGINAADPLAPTPAEQARFGGMFDLLTIAVSGHGSLDRGQNFLLKIITSDIPGGGA